ncbi:b(0,+)-type amino acid transporter 1 [Merluccius polli]|uniref:b(0,+)-type amino acid transporter 1 n=1 Tax=Merluccius polli TaxID=89951 RepID=A0AA47M2Q5_MERPO|nr:b(0,+)-type amino acid transporter 1 [Merluccius polli]
MDGNKQLNLQREVGLLGAVALIAGTMIGSGIFMSPQYVLSAVGSPGGSMVVWAACGLLACLASLCYAELGTVIRESGGDYVYILRTSGPVAAFTLAFSSVVFVRPAGVAGVALSFAQYAVAPFYDAAECATTAPPAQVVKCVAAAAILVVATVNCLDVRFAMSVQVFFLVAKVAALVVVVVGGVTMLVRGHFEDSFAGTNVGVSPIGIALYQGLWSYDGWNNLNYVTEELKRPEPNNMASDHHQQPPLNLRRELGVTSAVSFIAGTMIGSGIFATPQTVLSTIGSPGASLLIWLCCGLLALLGALCYAELGTVMPESGGEYVYLLRTAGRVVAFDFAFSFVAVMRPASATGIALNFAEYAVAPFYQGCSPPVLVVKCVAAAAILLLTLVNCLNVRWVTGVQVASMVVKVAALAVIVTGGAAMLLAGHTEHFDGAFEGTRVGVSSIGVAFYQGLWAYDGWNTLNYVTEELKRPEVHEGLKIKRELGLIGGVALVAGTMIGSGIFMSPQFVLSNVGSPGASLLIWTLSGLVAMCAALSYAEIGTIIAESGGDFIYILRIYGSCPAFFAALTFILVVRPASIAAISLSFAEYVVAPFYADCAPPPFVLKCTAAVAILFIATANILNVRLAIRIQVVFLVAKVFALITIIIGGWASLVETTHVISMTLNVNNAFLGTQLSLGTLGMAFYQGLWSFAGWYNLNYVTEELKRPEVNLPRAVLIAIPMVTVLYLLVNVSYLTVMTPRELMSSSAVAVTWGYKVLGSWGWIMSVAAALSAFGSLNGTFFSGGRVCFVAAREGHMVSTGSPFHTDILAMVHVHRLTPSPALIFTTIISLLVLIPGDFQSIVNFFSFTAWFFYAITISGLLYLKIKKPELPRPYKVPIIIPILVLMAAIFLVLAPIIDDPQIEYLYVTLFIFSGVLVYVPFIHYKLCPGLLTRLTLFLQLFLEVAPADKNL